MTFKEYQNSALQTLLYPGSGEILGLAYVVLGLNGEAGEVAEKVKKLLRDSDSQMTPEIKETLLLEAGDVLWYLGALCHELGVSLDEVAQKNVQKLSQRKIRGVLKGSGDYR
jgi:NTP pyrophosphatase (non-canonical NTP hydrolase)